MSTDYINSVKDGYSYGIKNSASYFGGYITQQTSGQYIYRINDAIQQLTDAINLHGNDNPANFGFMAEYWHAHTYNIFAAILQSDTYAKVEDSAASRAILGGPDIVLSNGEKVGLKYYASGKESAMKQAMTIKQRFMEYQSSHPNCTIQEYLRLHSLDSNTNINLPLYEGQVRLIPADQLKVAREALQKRIDHDLAVGGEQAKDVPALIETRDKLTTHIEGPNGEQSFKLTQEQAKQLQECARTDSFDPERYNISAAKLADRSILISNSFQAGLDAAWMSLLLKAAPQMIELIRHAAIDGYITMEDIRNLGKAAASSYATGFVRGSLSSYITTAAELGLWGDAFKEAALSDEFPATVAIVVTTIMEIASYSMDLARDKITKEEYFYNVQKTLFIASAGYLCGVSVQGLMSFAPGLGFMLGSMIGSMIGGLLFSARESILMSLCIERGFSFFGLVNQDYTLPDDVLKKMGFDDLDYDDLDYDELDYDDLDYDELDYDDLDYDELDIIVLKRGIIGIRKIGYVST
ncbi:MAG: hypothetical protein MJZ20_12395 [Bacteroidaceae bacterium]|nr:hypothetical protein [Bacteroidaceae bacterium]